MNEEQEASCNMYGCTPCPKCKKNYRVVFASNTSVVQCDDCGFEDPTTSENYMYYPEVAKKTLIGYADD